MNRVGQRVIADVQKALFARLMRADLAYFNGHPSGTLISRFTGDASLLRNAAANVLAAIGKDALTVIFLVGVMFYQDWLLALASFFAFPVAIRPIVGIGRRMRRVSANTQAEIGQLTTLLSQTFQGARLVKAYGMEAYEEAAPAIFSSALFGLIDRATRTRSRASPMMETLGRRGDRGRDPLWRPPGHRRRPHPGRVLLVHYRAAARLSAAEEPRQSERLAAGRPGRGAADLPGARCRADDPRPAGRASRCTSPAARFASIGCVSAMPPGAVALDDISLTVPAGRTVALVGASGAGKSTILNLIPRFFDVEEGSIAIDGQDVRAVTLASLRGAIALVLSRDHACSTTRCAPTSPMAVSARRRQRSRRLPGAAGADGFIGELPLGYDTQVGEHGRAPFRRPAPTAGDRPRDAEGRADPAARRGDLGARQRDPSGRSRRRLRALIRGRTTVVIAHRLSTIQGADLICVVDRGRIVESGRHAELLARDGCYARLYAMQFADDRDLATAASWRRDRDFRPGRAAWRRLLRQRVAAPGRPAG